MKKVFSFISVFLVLPALVFSSENISGPYSYEQLIANMNVSNIELLKQDEVIKQAVLDVKDAKANWQPQMDLDLMGLYMVNPPSFDIDYTTTATIPTVGQIPVSVNDTIELRNTYYIANLSLTQPLVTWGKIGNSVKLYNKVLDIRNIEKSSKIDQLSVELEGYLGALYYVGLILDDLEQAYDQAVSLVEISEDAFKQGTMLETDYQEAKLSLAEIEVEMTQVKNQQSDLLSSISIISGIDELDVSSISFVPDENEYLETVSMDPKELEKMVLSPSNKNLQMANGMIEVAELSEKIARGSMYGLPDLALKVSLGYGGSHFPLLQEGWKDSDDWGLNVTVAFSTTLWDGGKVLNSINRSKSQAESARLDLENAKDQLVVQLNQSLRSSSYALADIGYLEANSRLLESQLSLLEKELDAGYGSKADVISKKIDILTNDVELQQRKAELMQNALTIRYLSGM